MRRAWPEKARHLLLEPRNKLRRPRVSVAASTRPSHLARQNDSSLTLPRLPIAALQRPERAPARGVDQRHPDLTNGFGQALHLSEVRRHVGEFTRYRKARLAAAKDDEPHPGPLAAIETDLRRQIVQALRSKFDKSQLRIDAHGNSA